MRWIACGPVLLAGCAAATLPPFERVSGEATRTAVPDPGPTGLQVTARAVLRRGDTEFAFTLRAVRLLPDRMRVVALDDLGATLFHLVHRGTANELVHCGRAIPEPLVRDGIGPLLAAWLAPGSESDTTPVRLRSGPLGRLVQQGSRRRLHWIDATGARRTALAEDRTMWGELTVQPTDGTPRTAILAGHRPRFTLRLDVAAWQPTELRAATFDAPADHRPIP
ncbi:MAG: hypothetical protein H6837_05470 [Planctomycetes bacterium]|nr:hypothetical protein [Planctomycetota bacterium]